MSRRFLVPVCGAVLLLTAPAGCNKKALQTLDGGGGGILPPPADAGRDGAVRTAAACGRGRRDRRRVGRDVRGTSIVRRDVAGETTTAARHASHTFTMTLDTDQRIAIIGTPGSGDVMRRRADRRRRAAPSSGVGCTFAFSIPAVALAAPRSSTTISASSIDASGHAVGDAATGNGRPTTPSVRHATSPRTMVLTGVPDTDPPTLSLSAGGDLADPWTPLWVVSSEPLPAAQPRPVLRSTGGDFHAVRGPDRTRTRS